jgi:hypothetical protein
MTTNKDLPVETREFIIRLIAQCADHANKQDLDQLNFLNQVIRELKKVVHTAIELRGCLNDHQ